MSLRITSPAFEHEGRIPSRFTCEGQDSSPPLAWRGAPDGTRSFALIVDDPDAPDPAAPRRTFVHWVVVDIAPDISGIEEGASLKSMPRGAREGHNDANGTGWTGPCPPIGRHRYFFKIYALDTTLPDLKVPTKPELLEAMEGHVIEQAELFATYQKGD